MPADDKEVWAELLEVVRTLLATGKTSTHACELLLIALRGSAQEWLAAPASAAPAARAPLALCTQAGQPLLADLGEALLDALLTQVSSSSICSQSHELHRRMETSLAMAES